MEGKRLTAGKSAGIISNNTLSKRRPKTLANGKKGEARFYRTSEVESTRFVLGYEYGIVHGQLPRSSI